MDFELVSCANRFDLSFFRRFWFWLQRWLIVSYPSLYIILPTAIKCNSYRPLACARRHQNAVNSHFTAI